MTQKQSQPATFLETVLVLLEERFPWLGKSEQEEVSGADTIERLSELHDNLAEQLAQNRPACVHDNVEWDPVEIEYQGDRTAVVSQTGTCGQCGALCTITYTPGDPQAG